MDRYLESEFLMSTNALIAMSLDHEREMRDFARMEHRLAGSRKVRLSSYARIMSKVGDWLVVYGTWLKTHYSVQQAYRVN